MNFSARTIKAFLILLSLVSFNLSAMAYEVQYADEARIAPLRWKNAKIPIAVSTSLLNQKSNINAESDTEGAVRRSLETWEKVAQVKFEIIWTDLQTVSPAGNIGDGVSLITIGQTPENLSLFGSATNEISARTRIFFNRKGNINEADIVLNPYEQFSTDGAIGTFDLEATITHEIGHLLGLEHSSILSSTMYARQGKNGVLSLPGFSLRTLAEDDIAGIRALYGTNNSEENCCGRLQGKFSLSNGKPIKDLQVWAEEPETGRLMGGVLSGADGSFKIEGLKPGVYKIYSQSLNNKKDFFAVEDFEEVEIKKEKTTSIVKKIKNLSQDFNLQYIGFNGQLSELAIPMNDGKSYTIYFGGKNLDAKNLEVVFNSPFFTVVPESLTNLDFGSEISVVGFEVKVNPKTPFGQYSFLVKKQNGAGQYFVGGLTIEKFPNVWSNLVLEDK